MSGPAMRAKKSQFNIHNSPAMSNSDTLRSPCEKTSAARKCLFAIYLQTLRTHICGNPAIFFCCWLSVVYAVYMYQ